VRERWWRTIRGCTAREADRPDIKGSVGCIDHFHDLYYYSLHYDYDSDWDSDDEMSVAFYHDHCNPLECFWICEQKHAQEAVADVATHPKGQPVEFVFVTEENNPGTQNVVPVLREFIDSMGACTCSTDRDGITACTVHMVWNDEEMIE